MSLWELGKRYISQQSEVRILRTQSILDESVTIQWLDRWMWRYKKQQFSKSSFEDSHIQNKDPD